MKTKKASFAQTLTNNKFLVLVGVFAFTALILALVLVNTFYNGRKLADYKLNPSTAQANAESDFCGEDIFDWAWISDLFGIDCFDRDDDDYTGGWDDFNYGYGGDGPSDWREELSNCGNTGGQYDFTTNRCVYPSDPCDNPSYALMPGHRAECGVIDVYSNDDPIFPLTPEQDCKNSGNEWDDALRICRERCPDHTYRSPTNGICLPDLYDPYNHTPPEPPDPTPVGPVPVPPADPSFDEHGCSKGFEYGERGGVWACYDTKSTPVVPPADPVYTCNPDHDGVQSCQYLYPPPETPPPPPCLDEAGNPCDYIPRSSTDGARGISNTTNNDNGGSGDSNNDDSGNSGNVFSRAFGWVTSWFR